MNKLLYYAHRLKQLGIKQSYNRFTHRAIKTTQYYQLKYNLFNQASPTTFAQFSTRFKLKNIADAQQKLLNCFVTNLFNNQDFLATIPNALKDHKSVIEQANKIIQGQIELFGLPMQFSDWHTDYKQPDKPWPQNFYRDIKITAPKSNSIHDYHRDIKVPWELSRMHQMVTLGLAYRAAKDENPTETLKYVQAFEKQTTDWIDNNVYLYGVNWVCPMDVAIRAANLIWAYFLFQDASTLSPRFLQKLFCSLFDHSRYLEKNWETSPTPNNHYIADLIGYDYLCHFFMQLDPTQQFSQKQKNNFKILQEQFALQILPDGSAYEGSISYHRLDLEFYLHFYYLNQEKITPYNTKRLTEMLNFAKATTINHQAFIQIGDTDSGKLVFGLELQPLTQNQTQAFDYFGIKIIKQNDWLISHRIAKRAPNQPSGHFHEDHNSITISINQEPIIVDPGSYLYTANNIARNQFRSQQMHNGPQLYKKENDILKPLTSYSLETIDLFQLPENKNHDHVIERALHFNQTTNQLTIQDKYKSKIPSNNLVIAWNFLCAPQIGVEAFQDGWMLQSKTTKLKIQTTFTSDLAKNYYATQYGTIQPCWSLQAQESARPNIPYIITIEQIT